MLAIISIILLVLSYMVEKASIAFLLQIISTALFCGRQYGVLFKKKTIFTWEILGLIVTVLWKVIRKTITLKYFILVALLRGGFLIYVTYDFAKYKYITEQFTVTEDE